MSSQNWAVAKYWPVTSLGALVVACSYCWLKELNKHVPEPYMDEIFHIPQAQQYCLGNYFAWDPKLTTPPGLYAVSMFLKSVLPISFWPGKEAPRDSRPFIEKEGVDVLSKAAKTIFDAGCHITELRNIGVLTLCLMFLVCWQIRKTVQPNTNSKNGDKGWWVLAEPVAAAANICLFPPLFFFSGLYYTDVLSTYVVLLAYWAHLWRVEAGRLKKHNALSGVLVYTIGVLALTMRQTNIFWVGVFLAGLEWAGICEESVLPGSASGVEKPNVADQNCVDQTSSLYNEYAQGRLHNPPLSIASPMGMFSSPAFALTLIEVDVAQSLISLGISALTHPVHVVTRLWPYVSLLGTFAAFVIWNDGVVLGDKSNHVATIHAPQLLYLLAFTAFFSFPLLFPTVLSIFNDARNLKLPRVATVLGLAIATAVAMVVVHFNTIIHPFTLADNRHYMFYVFRYTVLRHPLIKYLLCPAYVLAGYLIFHTLAGLPSPQPVKSKAVANGHANGRQEAKPSAGPKTIFAIILAITTALSLITAPLVEPRYFIIPWVMWRLHIASYPVTQERIVTFMELLWYVAVNVATCWVFLNKPFEWPSEPGVYQRFMW